jgi:hypothetical protein
MVPNMSEPVSFEIPSLAGGDAGLEGFSVEAGRGRVGRVAALNETRDGLVLVVDTGDAYRPVPARLLMQIETEPRVVRLTREGEETLAAAPEIEPRVRSADTPQLVRHIPGQLSRLMIAGQRPRGSLSRLWLVGAPLVVLGGVGIMVGSLLTAEGAGGELRWLWVLIPLVVLAAGAWTLWLAMSRDSPRRLTRREKLWDAFTAILGITPRTRRRG